MKTINHDIIERLKMNSINLTTALLDAERTKSPVTFYTRTRHYIDVYRCIDTDNAPITLDNFVTHGGLVYYKRNTYDWQTISIDNISKIEILDK